VAVIITLVCDTQTTRPVEAMVKENGDGGAARVDAVDAEIAGRSR
jgi:hypothetical protein